MRKNLSTFSVLLFGVMKDNSFTHKTFILCNILLLVMLCYGRYFPFNESTEEGFWKLLSCLNTELHYIIVYFILHGFMSHLIIMFNACVTIILSNRNKVLIFMTLYKTLLMYHNREETVCKLHITVCVYLSTAHSFLIVYLIQILLVTIFMICEKHLPF